jgi:hypothetical protein
VPFAHEVDHEASHGARRIGDEASTIRKCRADAAREIEIRLVQQGGRADRECSAAAAQLAHGHPTQLIVQRREQMPARDRVAAAVAANNVLRVCSSSSMRRSMVAIIRQSAPVHEFKRWVAIRGAFDSH